MNQTIKAVIFDLDGTLIDTTPNWEKAIIKVLERRGHINLTPEENQQIKRWIHKGTTSYEKALIETYNLTDNYQDLHHEICSLIPETELTFIEGFTSFFSKLESTVKKTAIATNATHKLVSEVDKHVNLRKYFRSNIFSREDVGIGKPDPKLFLYTAEQLGVDPSSCVVFEDSRAGFEAAKAAGMTCIAIEQSYNSEHRKLTHKSIKNYHEAIQVLQELKL